MPPTPRQQQAALAVVIILLVAFAIAAPFAATPLPRLNAFIPTLQAVIFVTDLITAILLFGQYAIVGGRALLVLASGFLFTALIVVPHALSFPGVFAAAGLFGGLQTTVWLYNFWHFGFLFAVLAYALVKGRDTTASSRRGTACGVATVVVAVGLLTWIAARADDVLPTLYFDEINHGLSLHALAATNAALGIVVLISLWLRRTSMLDLWLMVAVFAAITEPILTGVLSGARFSLGFYASRASSIVASTVILAVLLWEAGILYTRLSRAVALLQHERDSKLMNMEAMVASITHEVRQPLAAIATNGSAALMFLESPRPDLVETRAALREIVQDSMNASQIFDGVRSLFRASDQKVQMVDVNTVALHALQMLRGELRDHEIMVFTALASRLPPVSGHKGQFLEVVLNLLRNAIDAMDTLDDRARLLRVTTARRGHDAITLSVEDSGPGIDPKKADAIFDAFVSTKAKGMGLGLAISRMIVEHHGGRISVNSEPGKGARFQIVLPASADMAV